VIPDGFEGQEKSLEDLVGKPARKRTFGRLDLDWGEETKWGRMKDAGIRS
jgi:hypothetical protein